MCRPRLGEVKHLCVQHAHRSVGAGSALLQHLELTARDLHLSSLNLTTLEGGGATAFYVKRGYEIYGRQGVDKGFQNIVKMKKQL